MLLYPRDQNIVIEEAQDKLSYILKTSNNRKGALKMVSEYTPAGIIGLSLASSTILLEIFLGDRPDGFVDVLPGFKLKWPQKHANEKTGVRILVKGIPEVNLTLESIQHQRIIDNIHLGPVSFKRLHFMPGELTPDQTTVIIDQ